MSERRTLAQGLSATPQALEAAKEKSFVFGATAPAQSAPPASPAASTAATPISTRLRSDLVAALKRASLERQLEGEDPSTLRDILEQAIEPWLRERGYLT